jgi:O-antigen/teichoic acid export membrane protein
MAEPEPDPPARHGRIGRDLFWAYAAAGAKVLSWVVVSGLVFRRLGAFELGMLALARATVGFLNYAGVGLAPALVHRMSAALAAPRAVEHDISHCNGGILSYATATSSRSRIATLQSYSNGLLLIFAAALLVFPVLILYSRNFAEAHRISASASRVNELSLMVALLGLGTLFRLISDVPGAVLQSTGWMWLDYLIMTCGELFWVAFTCYFALNYRGNVFTIDQIGWAFLISGIAVVVLRFCFAGLRQGSLLPDLKLISSREITTLLVFGSGVLLAQLADFLYAPVDFILIQNLVGTYETAAYAPAVQIDAGLLLIVSGLGMVILPRAAGAHSRGDPRALRRYYVHGTLASFAVLLLAAAAVWATAPMILRMWLGDEMRTTQAILPLVLVHTVIGGSSAVGRSILLGMGRVKAFTAAALIAGVMNVALSYVFVRYFGWGLKGIVLGTICVVVARCAVWMPWYVLKVTRDVKVDAVPPQVAGYMGT